MRIVFAGTTANAAEILSALANNPGHEIVAVLTRTDALVGRKKLLTQTPVAVVAESLGLPIYKANKLDETLEDELAKLNADLGVVVAYGALLKTSTLKIPKFGWINIHFSLLPRWRGAAPVQRALIAGDKETGVTIFQLDEGMDTGPIIAQVETKIEPDENADNLLTRLTQLSISMLDETLATIASGLYSPAFQKGVSTLAPKITRNEAQVVWGHTAEQIENLIRGCYPEPVAFALLNGNPIRLLNARVGNAPAPEGLPLGSVFSYNDQPHVVCGSGVLQLLSVQPAGRNVMRASDWLRGLASNAVLA